MPGKSFKPSQKIDSDDSLDDELKALFRRVESEPVSDELRSLARQLEARLKDRD